MKNTTAKKYVLFVGFAALVFFVILGIWQGGGGLECSYRINERIDPEGGGFGPGGVRKPALVWDAVEWCEPLAFTLLPLISLLFFSLITYKMRDNVFRAWWNFARWFVPIIIVATIALNNSSGGGVLGMDQDFTFLILFILYAILVIVSITKICFAYRKK
jgi:hypothetical protein